MNQELPIIQKTYDLIKWYVPILNRLSRDHKILLGNRIITGLYEFLENLVLARYEQKKLERLKPLNDRLDILRYQTRLLLEFELLSQRRYEYVSRLINGVGTDLGAWIRQQNKRNISSNNMGLGLGV